MGVKDEFGAAGNVQSIGSGDYIGTFINDPNNKWVVMLNKYGNEIVSGSFTLDSTGNTKFLLTGLVPAQGYRVTDNGMDMGVFTASDEGTVYFERGLGSVHTFIMSQSDMICQDTNNDNVINIIDLAMTVFWQGKSSGDADWQNFDHIDVNQDNQINFGDITDVITNFGQSC